MLDVKPNHLKEKFEILVNTLTIQIDSLLLRVTKEKEKSLTFPLSPVATAQSVLVSER